MNVSTSFIITGLFVFALAGFLGFETIRRVPRLLHTPLMALTNALSAISLVGSLCSAVITPPTQRFSASSPSWHPPSTWWVDS